MEMELNSNKIFKKAVAHFLHTGTGKSQNVLMTLAVLKSAVDQLDYTFHSQNILQLKPISLCIIHKIMFQIQQEKEEKRDMKFEYMKFYFNSSCS